MPSPDAVEPIAAGRASDILDLGDGLVLRRFKAGGDAEREALVMRHAAGHGYPVPHVEDVRDDGLVLERIEGPTMAAYLRRHPWALRRQAALLARLHAELHQIQTPPQLNGTDSDRLLHLDLHPENVLLSPAGPVVLDWTNAAAGEPALDAALTWVIAATSGGLPGRLFARAFLPHFDRHELHSALPAAAAFRLADVNVTEAERAAVRRLLRTAAEPAAAPPG